MRTILINRRYLPDFTLSELITDNFSCWVLEPPWKGNAENVSCIPEGIYIADRIDNSSKTGGHETFELINVPDRTEIQIHPGNWVKDTLGCMLVGKEPTVIKHRNGDSEYGVPASRATFYGLMANLAEEDRVKIIVRKH